VFGYSLMDQYGTVKIVVNWTKNIMVVLILLVWVTYVMVIDKSSCRLRYIWASEHR